MFSHCRVDFCRRPIFHAGQKWCGCRCVRVSGTRDTRNTGWCSLGCAQASFCQIPQEGSGDLSVLGIEFPQIFKNEFGFCLGCGNRHPASPTFSSHIGTLLLPLTCWKTVLGEVGNSKMETFCPLCPAVTFFCAVFCLKLLAVNGHDFLRSVAWLKRTAQQ